MTRQTTLAAETLASGNKEWNRRKEIGGATHAQRTRVGVVEGERRSALHLRAFCAAQFEPGVVGPSYNATAKAYGVRNATDAGAEEWLLLW